MLMYNKDTGEIKFPTGCTDCKENVSCHDCNWPENYWKYDRISYYFTLAIWSKSGFDLNRLKNLLPDDFVKISFVKKLIPG